MQQDFKISVCMITYGHEKYIRQAIEGVLMQECDFEVELILSNDCSPDQTDKVIQEILSNHPKASSIKYFKHEKNIGMMANFIFAMQECHGSYIALCEGDDYWTDPLKLQKQIIFLQDNKDYVLCFHPVNVLKINGQIVNDFITKVPENYETIETLASSGNYIHTPSVVFRNIISDFPFEFEQTPIGDYFLYLMLAQYGKLKCLETKMAVYRYGVGVFSGTSSLNIAKCNLQLLTCLLSYFQKENINKILLKQHLQTVIHLEEAVHNVYSNSFVSNNFVFKLLKTIRKDYKTPKKISRKIFNKLKNSKK